MGFSLIYTPILGCALATGLIYSSLIEGVAFAPEQDSTMFNYASLGFAFVETFAFTCVGASVFVLSL